MTGENDPIYSYILAHIEEEPKLLNDIYRSTWLNHLYPRMCSGHLQGRILKILTAIKNPRRVLELGTFTGYSALSIAEGLSDGAVLHTVEIDDELTDELTALFASTPLGDKINLHIGDALQLIPSIGKEWDMVYIDADKRLYRQYLDMLLPTLSPNALIIADNTLWGGKVAHPDTTSDAQTKAILDFNDYVAHHPRLSTVILPLRDGLTLMTLKPA
ncbi:MAG: O-methyltransferase [Paramuribaculum sp.]|nr:O-methyltransferase [Paramuribaculum sp.]